MWMQSGERPCTVVTRNSDHRSRFVFLPTVSGNYTCDLHIVNSSRVLLSSTASGPSYQQDNSSYPLSF